MRPGRGEFAASRKIVDYGAMDDAERQRIRSYLQAQAAKLTPGQVVDKIREAMTELRQAAAAVPKDRFEERPAPEEWSGNEVMAHVVDAGRHFGDHIVAVLDGRPRVERDSSAGERRPATEWSVILERDRAEALRVVKDAGLQPQ